jgi:hypothetical protein
MRTPASPPPLNQVKHAEDKRLERLYDYTKFHIGIYLSTAGGVTALAASKDLDWIVAKLIGFPPLLYVALVLLVFAGMCGGMVATSITKSLTFDEFWAKKHYPGKSSRLGATGETWVHNEHRFFWASLITLAAAILIPYRELSTTEAIKKPPAETPCCCICQSQPTESAKGK